MRRLLIVLFMALPLSAGAQQVAQEDTKVLQTKLDVCQWQLQATSNQLAQALTQANGRVEALQKQLAAQTPKEPAKDAKPGEETKP